MGTSIIGQLVKMNDGRIFQEDFENNNFIAASGWTVIQGTPVASDNQSVQGFQSFQCSGTGNTLAIISKSLPAAGFSTGIGDNPGFGGNYWQVEVSFYDDGTISGTGGPYLKLHDTSGRYIQVGVRNNVSTYRYVCNTTGNFSEDNFGQLTGANRTVGWRLFQILGTNSSGPLFVGVDGSYTSLGDIQTLIDTVFICSGTKSDTGGTFGYFDSLNITSDSSVYIYGLGGRTVNVYDSSWNLLQSASVGAGLIWSFVAPGPPGVQPIFVYITISQLSNLSSVEYSSPLLTFYMGDYYLYQPIDFGRKFVTPQPVATTLLSQSQTEAGANNVLTFGYKDKYQFGIQALPGTSWEYQLDNFFAGARLGTPFSVLTDSNSCAFSPITASAQAGQSSVTGLLNNALTIGSTAVGPYYMLQDFVNKNKQMVTVQNISGTGPYTITFNEILQFPITAGEFYLRDQYFFPQLELDEPYDMSGFTWLDARNLLSNFNLNARDYVGP